MKRRPLLPILLLALAAFLLIGVQVAVRFLADWYWFSAIHFSTVFDTEVVTQVVLAVVGGGVTFGFLYANLRYAQRGAVPHPVLFGTRTGQQVDLSQVLRRVGTLGAVFVALIVALAASGIWLDVVRFLHRTPFGRVDPVFGRDIGYYVFTLPIVSIAIGFVDVLTVLALLATVPIYVLRRDIVLHGRRVMVERSAAWHLAALLTLLGISLAVSAFFVKVPSLLYSTTGPLFGASYTDLHVSAPFFRALGVAALVGAVLVLLGARGGHLARNALIAAGLYVGVAVLGVAMAAGIQDLVVAPNELVRETPQIAHHIAATRRAWGLDSVTTRDLSGDATLSLADIQANAGTIRNVRLWDRGPLLQTFRQLQEIRTYYDFRSVDDDRYWINGEYRQVLLSARELNSASLPTRNFINEHLTYTHGMGLTLSPPNEVSEEGLPVLFVKDLPPTSTVSLDVKRPGLYYGELENEYVFVDTRQPEFDYPLADTSAFTSYHGAGGVPVSSFFRRLVMSMRFGSSDILFTSLITPKSRVLYYRNIDQRVRKALPFLLWDSDPYLVITPEGRLVWILDGYTATSRYPYSEPLQDGTNYLRNSVKVVLDAYDGTIKAYVAAPHDPLIQTYEKAFPGIFLPLDSMPQGLRAHIRYPSDLFRIQTSLYTTYHMGTPDVFYSREDQWQIPNLSERNGARDPFMRHMIMRLPGESQEEYISMTPFTPRNKDNLAAWMVARSDGADYGQLVVYRFPKQSLVFGPSQIENRINQNTDISRQISLWDQRGSEVIRGNLLVIPIGESLIYVQALYLRASGGQIPELKRVIVAYQNQVVMGETLDDAIGQIFGSGAVPSAGPAPRRAAAAAAAAAPSGPAGALSPQALQLIQQISDAYDAATTAQRAGDWSAYGKQMDLVGQAIKRLQALTGGNGQ
ncbi:MAG TPA: UPF0182 family protein [Gemmatimonadales bacterium]|nr:UPF0182 family protein [Gemmatimonadales bacterium]